MMENYRVHKFSQLGMLTRVDLKLKMDALVADLNNALEDTTSVNTTRAARRKTWKRRCKSTSNLAIVGQKFRGHSDDSSSSLDVERLSRDRGTSSLQLSDSDEVSPSIVMRFTSNKQCHTYQKCKKKKLGNTYIESDSVNENFSPMRANTRRTRKFKRMSVDHDISMDCRLRNTDLKRKKARNRMDSDRKSNLEVIPGKRKRSVREKSVETDHILFSQSNVEKPVDRDQKMETGSASEGEEVVGAGTQSSSSFSSSEVESDFGITDREADDEHSDWPGCETQSDSWQPSQSTTGNDRDDLESGKVRSKKRDAVEKVSPNMKQPYFARMERLAECLPSREMRAGRRSLRNLQPGYSIKSTSSELVSRFLQDPYRKEMQLHILRASERKQVIHLANLYNLLLKQDPSSNIINLSKTGKTLRVDDAFAVPGPIMSSKAPIDFKRLRRTPPTSPVPPPYNTQNNEAIENSLLYNNFDDSLNDQYTIQQSKTNHYSEPSLKIYLSRNSHVLPSGSKSN